MNDNVHFSSKRNLHKRRDESTGGTAHKTINTINICTDELPLSQKVDDKQLQKMQHLTRLQLQAKVCLHMNATYFVLELFLQDFLFLQNFCLP